jgi:CHAT domain-containing protein
MKYLPKSLIIAILILFSSGCVANVLFREKDRLTMGGQYSELERISEGENKDFSSAKSEDLIGLCIAYSKLKKYNKSFSCLEQLENKIKKGDKIVTGFGILSFSYPKDITVIPSLLKAEAYIELVDYDQSVTLAKKAYELLPTIEWPLNDRYFYWELRFRVRSLGILALAYALKGDRNNASHYAVKLENEKTGFLTFMNSPGAAIAIEDEKLLGLIRVYMALGQYDKILALTKANKEGFLASYSRLMEGVGSYALFAFVDLPKQFIINKALYETGNIKEAKEGYDKLLSNPETKSNGEIYWPILFDRGRISQGEGDTKQAVDFYKQAIDVIENQRSTINTEASKIGFVGDKQAVYHNLVRALYQDKQYEKAFEYVERAKSRSLVDLLASKKDFAVKGGNEKEIRTALAMNDSAEMEAIIQDASIDKSKTRSIQVKTREDLKARSPELSSLVTVTSQPIAEIQSLIPKAEALIEYYYRDKDMYAFILSDGKLQTVKLDSEGMAEDIQAFRKLIDTPSSTQFMDLSRKLYKRLFQPLESALNKRNLIIVSHGTLHYLPVNALHDGGGYLIDRYSIRMMPSASAMKYLQERKADKSGGILIFGNPDLGDPKYDLEYAQKEATEVAKIRPKSKVFLRKEATEGMLRQYSKDYSYLHFATHGQFNPEAPLQSALLLAPNPQYNGILTVDKLYSLNLNADLVTLSACETGLSKIANGDDLVGLTRGFLYAGSSSIVASLWKVDDLATSHLMMRFYMELDKTNKGDALRTAQLEMKKKYPHPYYWASFQLTGNAN